MRIITLIRLDQKYDWYLNQYRNNVLKFPIGFAIETQNIFKHIQRARKDGIDV